jgi:hypothetical protein
MEEALWFTAMLQPSSRAYHRTSGFELRGAVTAERLQGALDALVRLHPALRTVFRRGPTGLYAEASPSTTAALRVLPLREGGDGWKAAALHQARPYLEAPFDVAKEVFRCVYVAGDGVGLLVLQAHHIVMDALSDELLFAHLAQALEGGDRLVPSPAPAGDAPGDLTGPLRELCALLEGAPALLSLSGTRPRPKQREPAGSRQPVSLVHCAPALRELCKQERATAFMVLLAAWAWTLSEASGERDLVIGAPFSTRRPDQERQVGCFVNMVPLRVRLEPGDTLRGLVARVRPSLMPAYAAARVPFAKVCAELRRPRASNYHPVFQAGFTLRPAQTPSRSVAGLELIRTEADIGAYVFDWKLDLEPSAEGFRGYVEYASDITPVDVAQRLASVFSTISARGLASPDVPLQLLSNPEVSNVA